MYGAHFTHLTVVSNKRSCTPLFGATVNCDFPFQILPNSVSNSTSQSIHFHRFQLRKRFLNGKFAVKYKNIFL